jgi:uncharacterized protein with NAD-binding domain and iron-sulfur cluster
MGSLSAVLRLTEAPDWRTRHDISIYQLGWRLGGKGASGRNMAPEYCRRIEEHGVHVFFGFYTNAFRLMKACYDELGRPPGALLRTWDEAFKGLNNVVLAEQMPGGNWEPWQFEPPRMSGEPTDDRSSPDIGDCLETVTAWFTQALDKLSVFSGNWQPSLQTTALQVGLATFEPTRLLLAAQLAPLIGQIRAVSAAIGNRTAPTLAIGGLYQALLGGLVRTLAAALDTFWLLFASTIRNPSSGLAGQVRMTWLLCNFIYANLHGVHADQLLLRGVRTINHRDYRDWIAGNGLNDGGAMGRSSLVRWLYDAVFSYRQGDIGRPDLEAGTGLLATLRLLLTYNGHFLYKMQAGMGDVVFAPIYEVLQRRGVKFEFFHRVVGLDVATMDGRPVVSRVRMERQAVPIGAAGTRYRPLIDVTDSQGRGLPCWPSEPDYAQLQNGAALKASLAATERTLEEYEPSPQGTEVVLVAGQQFDEVLLGIGIGAAGSVCKNLAAVDPAWQRMVLNVGTVATVGVQLWLDRDLAAMSGAASPLASPMIFCGYDYDAAPIDSYADMTQVLPRETWPAGPGTPRSVGYFCSPLNDARPTLGAAGAVAARALATTLLVHHIGVIWPRATTAGGVFDWNRLVDPRQQPGTGPARLDAQFCIGVANPSDRYVASFTGSTQHRLWADQSGFANLFLTGDWVRNTLDIGCIEATVMAGLQAANGLLGQPRGDRIAGWEAF